MSLVVNGKTIKFSSFNIREFAAPPQVYWVLEGSNNELSELRISFAEKHPALGPHPLGKDSKVSISIVFDDRGLLGLESGKLTLDEISTESPLMFRGTFYGENTTEGFSLENGQYMLKSLGQ